MKQTVFLLALATSLLLGACVGDSKLPKATGKASITAINAIQGSPTLNFLIEERSIGTVAYKGTSTSGRYDDLEYDFNFDALFAGDTALTRIATEHIDFIANQNYTLLASGTMAAPVLTVWEEPERDFVDTDTAFQARFAHTSSSLSAATIDIYFAPDGVAPVLGEQVATLNFGEISAALDFESGDYVLIITTAGDPADVLFTSRPTNVFARNDLIITPFDGDANDTTSLVVRGLGAQGSSLPFRDPLATSTVQFLHAAMEMGATDVFDDAALSSQILSNHAYRDLTAEFPVAPGNYEYFYTPTGGTTVVSLDTTFIAGESQHFRIAAVGSGGSYSTINTTLNRRSISTAAKLLYFQTSNNFDLTDLFLVDAGTSITDQLAFRSGIPSRIPGVPLEIAPGSYDLFITDSTTSDILAGPFRLDVALGDVVDMVVFDNPTDPAVLDMVVYPTP